MSASNQALLTTPESKTGKAGNASAQAKKPKLAPPTNSSVDQISFLQRTVGNREVERLLKSRVSQAELASGASVAKSGFQPAVTALPTGPLIETNLATGQPNHPGNVASGGIATVPLLVQEVLRSPGQPLDPATCAFMEPCFGHDFGSVRVHTDAKAAESARAVSALAYTVGHNVVFGENRYAPATHAGRELLAHELAHTIQQRNASSALSSPEQDGSLESSATMAARSVAAGQRVPLDLPTSGIGLSRSPDDDERAKLIAEAEAALAKMEEEERETAKEEAEEAAANQRRAEAMIPTTLSLIHPDPRQISDEEIYGEIWARKREEEKATRERKQKELEESHDRLLLLRGMLDPGRSGYIYTKPQIMAMLTKDSLLDGQILRRYGVELPPSRSTKQKTFTHQVVDAIDKFDYDWRKTHGTAGPAVSPTDVKALEAMQRQQEAEAARWEGLEHVEGSLPGAVGAEVTSWFTSDPKKITAGAKMGTAVSGTLGSVATAKATQIEQGAIRESSTPPAQPAAVGTKSKSEPPPTPAKAIAPKPPAKSSQSAKATTRREMQETAAQKSGAKGQKGSKGKATTQREMAEAAAQKMKAMAGKRRVGDEHTSGARPSTAQAHEVGVTRKGYQEAAADLRNELSRREALESRVRQLASEFESTVKNMPEGQRKFLSKDKIPVQDRYNEILKKFSAADMERIEQLRTQLRRELNIRGSELDDYIIDHLDKLGLLPVRPE
jgi:uncharacterized protein (UPF0254 family)